MHLTASPGRHELAIVCRALSLLPVPRRPRGRWRSSLEADQSLRWRRTPLIGRIPWAGTAPVIGPWGQVSLLPVPQHGIELTGVCTELDADLRSARVLVDCMAERGGHLELACAGAVTAVEVPAGESRVRLEVREPTLWWPATHGEPALHELTVRAGSRPGQLQPLARRSVGFRRLEAQTDDGGFRQERCKALRQHRFGVAVGDRDDIVGRLVVDVAGSQRAVSRYDRPLARFAHDRLDGGVEGRGAHAEIFM